MNAKVVFHVMPEADASSTEASHQQPPHWLFACQQAAQLYRDNKRVFMFTDSKELAHELDELLWQFEPDSFVPHNLPGEGGQNGAPVEISWQAPQGYRQVLINLSNRVPQFADRFTHIVDFVPNEEALKQLARQRYRLYQNNGYQVDTHKL